MYNAAGVAEFASCQAVLELALRFCGAGYIESRKVLNETNFEGM